MACATLAAALPATGSEGADAAPLSSIGWLSRSLAEPPAVPAPRTARDDGVAVVRVTPLDAPTLRADPAPPGLHDPRTAGLSPDFWGPTTSDAVAARLAAFPEPALPAARDALARLIATRFDPPRGGGTPGVDTLARIDTALLLGRLDIAAALVAQADGDRPEVFRRAFDIGLLTGTEDRGCARLAETPGLSASYPARIFCLARGGDWPAAAVTLETAGALGQVSAEEDALLARFLDAELAEAAPALPAATRPTPLEWRMREAIGGRPPTATLPLAFAHADLRPTAGWRARIAATERLARAGAIPPDRLLAIYSERRPAASGGVWDRVAAMQALDAALDSGDPDAIERALPRAWEAAMAAGLAVPLAEALAPLLAGREIADGARGVSLRIALLSGTPEAAVAWTGSRGAALPAELAAGRAIAQGGPPPRTPEGTDRVAHAVAAAFAPMPPPPPDTVFRLRAEGRNGEAVLAALAIVARGRDADADDLAGALAALRDAGLETTARRAALQILLLENPA